MAKKERLTYSGEPFTLGKWGDSIYLKEARNGKYCTEIREFIPQKHEAQDAEYMMFCHGLQPELTRDELNEFALKILSFTGYFDK
jgi:hypothetical protein